MTSKAGKAGGFFAGAGIEAHFTLLFLSFALVWLLNEAMHIAIAFAIVAVLHGAIAFVLYTRARSNLARVERLQSRCGRRRLLSRPPASRTGRTARRRSAPA